MFQTLENHSYSTAPIAYEARDFPSVKSSTDITLIKK
jgi:hypothetical protein